MNNRQEQGDEVGVGEKSLKLFDGFLECILHQKSSIISQKNLNFIPFFTSARYKFWSSVLNFRPILLGFVLKGMFSRCATFGRAIFVIFYFGKNWGAKNPLKITVFWVFSEFYFFKIEKWKICSDRKVRTVKTHLLKQTRAKSVENWGR